MASQGAKANVLVSLPRISITVGIALAVGIVAVTSLYVLVSDEYRGALIFFAASVAAAAQLATALYTARVLQFTMNSQIAAEARLMQKESQLEVRHLQDSAAEFGRRWTDASMFHIRKQCKIIIDRREKPYEVLNEIKKSDDTQTNVGNVLNFLEELALSVNSRRCDGETAKKLFCGIVVNIWHATEPWVKEQRTTRGRAQLWSEFEALYHQWKI